MVTHIKRSHPMDANSPWVKAVKGLSSDPKSVNRAITTIMLLGIKLDFNSTTYSAGDRSIYGNWLSEAEAAVAYCVAEGLDIET